MNRKHSPTGPAVIATAPAVSTENKNCIDVFATSCKMLKYEEVSATLQVSKRTLVNLIESGGFPPPLKLGRLRRFHPQVLADFLRKSAELP